MADISKARGSLVVTVIAGGRSVFGNKRTIIADLVLNTGPTSDTFPTAGISLVPADFGMKGIDFMSISQGSLLYSYDYTNQVLQAYTAAGTTGATYLLIQATQAVPVETIRVTVYGYGLA